MKDLQRMVLTVKQLADYLAVHQCPPVTTGTLARPAALRSEVLAVSAVESIDRWRLDSERASVLGLGERGGTVRL